MQVLTLLPFCVALSDLKISTSSSLEGPSAMMGYFNVGRSSSVHTYEALAKVNVLQWMQSSMEDKEENAASDVGEEATEDAVEMVRRTERRKALPRRLC